MRGATAVGKRWGEGVKVREGARSREEGAEDEKVEALHTPDGANLMEHFADGARRCGRQPIRLRVPLLLPMRAGHLIRESIKEAALAAEY